LLFLAASVAVFSTRASNGITSSITLPPLAIMEPSQQYTAMDSSIVVTPDRATLDATFDAGTDHQNNEEVRPLAIERALSQDHTHTETEDHVEVLPEDRTALLDYDLAVWERATLYATRTRYVQHVIGWMFEQVLGHMASGIVSQSGYCL
jgi:hypothetical protein